MRSRPWWLWLATASFIGYAVFLHSAVHYGRELIGFSTTIERDGIYIQAVTDGSPSDRAGLRAGDRIVTFAGLPMADQLDFITMQAAYPIGVPVVFEIERDRVRSRVTLEPMSRAWLQNSPLFVAVGLSLVLSMALGLLLAWRGDGRPATMLAALLLCSIGCASIPIFPRSMGVFWSALPLPVALLIWPGAVGSIFTPVWMFAFCALVPAPVLPRRWLIAALVPIVTVTLFVTISAILVVHYPEQATRLPMPMWMQVGGPLSYSVYFAASAAMLIVSLRRATDRTERRRLQILLAGTVLGVVGLLLVGVSFATAFFRAQIFLIIGGAIFCTLPISFAYATLRHRLFDLRVIVRLGLQYALARGMILAVIPLLIAALIVDAARHSDQTLQAILAARGWPYGIIAAVATLIYFKRDEWMTALDRKFFRERYAAQQILRDVVQDVGTSSDLGAAAQRVVARIDSALHPVMTAVMMRPRTATAFSAVAISPSGHGVPTLPAGSSITQVVRALGRPVVFGAQGVGDVPADQPWLATTQAELIVPIAVDTAKDEAVLVLGPRRSEEPYSKEDLELLTAIGASLGLLMGRVETTDLPTMTGSHANTTRLIAGRYRIERPIGEGGMGVVYAATDETLARRVAIKVIKDQHLLGTDDLARFQREARTVASLSHPHIVTIHDYGVDDGGSPYLVMELLAGRSLRSAIKDGPIPPARALPILTGLAAGVDAAHATGVIHRDLKPENVFLVGDTHAKILDYGIAKAIASTTTTRGGVAGTLAYMAPEQAAGGDASPAWDVWSLSVIAFEMLTGQHPFGGGLPVARSIPIATLVPELDERMAKAIDRSLSHTVADRPASAGALLTLLRSP